MSVPSPAPLQIGFVAVRFRMEGTDGCQSRSENHSLNWSRYRCFLRCCHSSRDQSKFACSRRKCRAGSGLVRTWRECRGGSNGAWPPLAQRRYSRWLDSSSFGDDAIRSEENFSIWRIQDAHEYDFSGSGFERRRLENTQSRPIWSVLESGRY